MGYPWTTGSGTMRKEAGQTHKSLISSWILSWEVWGHFRGLSQARTLKVHNPALPPSFGVLTRRQLFHGSWTSNIIRNRWWMKWKKKKLKSYPCRCQKCYLFWNGNPLQNSCLKTPWLEEPGGLQSKELQRVGHDWATKHMCTPQ